MRTEVIDGNSLDGVSATTLYTLCNRAHYATGPDKIIDDPLAVALYERISYDWDKFGFIALSAAMRANAYDGEIRKFLAENPTGTVVALGEGLQTTYWRLGSPSNTWYSIDLAPVIDVRERLLPESPYIRNIASSAFDTAWMDSIESDGPVLVTAEGLLMYFDEEMALGLVRDCAARFSGGGLIFDSIPKWLSKKTMAGFKLSDSYTIPEMPFGMGTSRGLRMPKTVPGVVSATEPLLVGGSGMWKFRTHPRLANLPVVRDRRPSITSLRFS